MEAFIPIYNGCEIDEQTMTDLGGSPYVSKITVVEGGKNHERGDVNRYKAIYKNRLEIFKQAIESKEDFFIMCNADRMSYKTPHLGEMIEFMADHPECGLVAYIKNRARRDAGHVNVGFCIVRTEAVKCLIDEDYDFERCECLYINWTLRENGFRVSYVGEKVHDRKGLKLTKGLV